MNLKGKDKTVDHICYFRLSGAEYRSDRVDLRVRGGKQQETDSPDRNCFISLMSTVTGRRMKSDS